MFSLFSLYRCIKCSGVTIQCTVLKSLKCSLVYFLKNWHPTKDYFANLFPSICHADCEACGLNPCIFWSDVGSMGMTVHMIIVTPLMCESEIKPLNSQSMHGWGIALWFNGRTANRTWKICICMSWWLWYTFMALMYMCRPTCFFNDRSQAGNIIGERGRDLGCCVGSGTIIVITQCNKPGGNDRLKASPCYLLPRNQGRSMLVLTFEIEVIEWQN